MWYKPPRMNTPKKILVADDQVYMHRLLQHHLKRAGFEVLTAANGREALEQASRAQPDLVVMDVMMRELDGLAALRELKADEATRGIPVILVTTSAQVTAQQAGEFGAAAFFTKPFSPTLLLAEIKRLLAENG
jgi:CheY-like chemotaxis protein